MTVPEKVKINVRVHEPLMAVREEVLINSKEMSGENKYQGFKYYQLVDFMPALIQSLRKNGLSYVENFSPTEASLTVIDKQSGSYVTTTCPIDYSHLKGSSPMQSIGASMTYARRYLWVSLLGLVEYDPKNGGDVDLDQLDQSKSAVDPQAKTPQYVQKHGQTPNNVMEKLQAIRTQNLEKRGNNNDS
tara:strand:- start:1486 stop:2049 length:564 start_codon:yes stop_codon:yes gene_type:complete